MADTQDRTTPDVLARAVVEAATRAPSVHNTQPWRFAARPAGVVEVWTDPNRNLDTLDPHGRERVLSCGAAVLTARVAAAGLGAACRVTTLPDPAQPEHLADLLLDPARTPEVADRELAPSVDVRRTQRGAFEESAPVTPAELARLGDAVRAEGCWLRVVSSPDDAAAVAVLLARADDVQAADPAYREELARWTGRDDASPDGVPAGAATDAAPQERGSSYRLRDFDATREPAGPRWAGLPPRPEHPTVVVLGTADDDPSAWLAAGQALGRLLLTATRLGLAASPMTQVLEVEDTRVRLGHELGLLGHPQVVLRLGHPVPGDAPRARSGRRPVDEVLADG